MDWILGDLVDLPLLRPSRLKYLGTLGIWSEAQRGARRVISDKADAGKVEIGLRIRVSGVAAEMMIKTT